MVLCFFLSGFRGCFLLRLLLGLFGLESRKLTVIRTDEIASHIALIAIAELNIVPGISVSGLQYVENLYFIAFVQAADDSCIGGGIISDHDTVCHRCGRIRAERCTGRTNRKRCGKTCRRQ